MPNRSTAPCPAEPAEAPLRVLVVEDEYLVAMDLELSLVAAGYVVVGIAASGAEALAMAARAAPDVATMDINLQGAMDGIDTAAQLRERFGIRSLFITAYSDAAIRSRGAAVDPLGWETKPFEPERIARLLAQGARARRWSV